MNQKIFISYSWSSPDHEEWVLNLAERLVSDGVDVVLDKWDLKEGQDKYDFMESMVKSPEINKVLVILDEQYTDKAELRSGGVGTETQIISPEIYENTKQEKFIPVVSSYDDEGNPFIPTYLKGRIYIDLARIEIFENNYVSLLRNIYNRPSFRKPKLGKAPSFLFEDSPMTFKTTQILRSFETVTINHPERVNSVLKDFFENFTENLKEFQITFEDRTEHKIGKQICDNHNEYMVLREDFLKLLDKLLKSEIKFDVEVITKFLEQLYQFQYPLDKKGSWSDFEYDNFRLIMHELFIYIIAIGIKNGSYSFLEDILNSSYFVSDRYSGMEEEPKNFDSFYHHVNIFDRYYKEAFSKNYFSCQAELMISRLSEIVTKKQFVNADLICYYIAQIQGLRWFPQTYIYDTRKVELFYRMVSLKHFKKVKGLFGVNNIDEFKELMNKFEEKENGRYDNWIGYSGSTEQVRPIYSLVDIEKIGTKA